MGTQYSPYVEKHSLQSVWWLWTHPRVHRAVLGAWLDHFRPTVQALLDANLSKGRWPSRWAALMDPALWRVDVRNTERILEGKHNPTPRFLIGVASLLQRKVSVLIPDNHAWLRRIVVRFSDNAVTDDEASAYVAYRLAQPRFGPPEIDSQLMVEVASQMKGYGFSDQSLTGKIAQVARVLEPILTAINDELA